MIDVKDDDPIDPTTETKLKFRNILPAPFLANRFRVAVSTTLFSAILSLVDYFSDMLGLPETTQFLQVAAPFKPAQLQVLIDTAISTRYDDRPRSIDPVILPIFNGVQK